MSNHFQKFPAKVENYGSEMLINGLSNKCMYIYFLNSIFHSGTKAKRWFSRCGS